MNINKNKIFLLMVLSFVFNLTKTTESASTQTPENIPGQTKTNPSAKNTEDSGKNTDDQKKLEDLKKDLTAKNTELSTLETKRNTEKDESKQTNLDTIIKSKKGEIREIQAKIDNIEYKDSFFPISFLRSIQNTTEDYPKSTIGLLTAVTAGLVYVGYKALSCDNSEDNDYYEDEEDDSQE